MHVICYSHLRWNFVYQRPQHLMSRIAKQFPVVFVEEPVFDAAVPMLEHQVMSPNLWILVPHLPAGISGEMVNEMQGQLLKNYFETNHIEEHIAWYYTPMALAYTQSFKPSLVIYDCMDELSAFKNAPLELRRKEEELFHLADLVFTGGYSLYKAKKSKHPEVFLLPSSIDKEHFAKARQRTTEPFEQSVIPHPRIGFFGVIDERMDLELVEELAKMKPEWHFIFIGPVVKISPESLPLAHNLHFLGSRSYGQLPDYISGWEVAIMPFAINEATRFISPTKTPEYLAAGRPVVSTPIHDVVHDYGGRGLVYIAGDAAGFARDIDSILKENDRSKWLSKVDQALAQTSWDLSAGKIMTEIERKLTQKKEHLSSKKESDYV